MCYLNADLLVLPIDAGQETIYVKKTVDLKANHAFKLKINRIYFT